MVLVNSLIYFYLLLWGVYESIKFKKVPETDVYLVYIIILFQTSSYGGICLLLISGIIFFSCIWIAVSFGCIERPRWMDQLRTMFNTASGINFDRLNAAELTKLEANCSKIIDENLKNWFQEKEVVCSICLDEFKTNENIIIFPECKHIYHKNHIVQWLGVGNNLCPLCKSDVREQIKKLPGETNNTEQWLDDLIKSSQDRQNPVNIQNATNLNNPVQNDANNSQENQGSQQKAGPSKPQQPQTGGNCLVADPNILMLNGSNAWQGHKSLGEGTSFNFKIKNDSNEGIYLDWLNFNGDFQNFAYIQKGEEINQQTFVSHPWLLSTQDGKPLALLKNVEEQQENSTICLCVNPNLLVFRC